MRSVVLSFLALLLVPLLPARASAASCTDGVDCYCDLVAPGGPLEDTSLLMCEDFEFIGLTTDLGHDVAPNYGPWYDHVNSTPSNMRGGSSWWFKNYNAAVSPCSWHLGQPANPTKGITCAYDSCPPPEWSPTDEWDGNDQACIDIIRDGEFQSSVPSTADPIGTSTGGNGVFDGQQSFGLLVPIGKTAGVLGSKQWGRHVTTLGLTLALAYPWDVRSSGVLNSPWKHDEFRGSVGFIAHFNLGFIGEGKPNSVPYSSGFLFNDNGGTKAWCEASVAAATVSVGTTRCANSVFYWGAGAAEYDQETHFPWGTWACHQAYISGLGTSNVTFKVWHNEVLVFSMTGFDGTKLNATFLSGMYWNNYANANSGTPGDTPTTRVTARYEDNAHYTEGMPVSCQAIGFRAGAPPPDAPLAAPALLP